MQVLNELRRLLAERGHRVELHLPPHPAAAGEAEDCPSPQQLAACTAVVALADRDLAYWLPALAERAIPVVGLSQELPNAVYCDVPGMVRRGAVLPLELGRRRPALYAHEHDVPGRPSTWIGGLFREALAAAGVTVPAERLLGGHWQAQSPQGWHRLRELLARPPAVRPDSLFIADETLAGQAVVAVLESGLRVPEDLLVVSHAHRGSSTFYPFPVYRLEMPHAEVARGLVEALERLEAAPDRPLGHTVLPPRLVPPRPADAAG
jgi:DNA-binding LacI/PurR family transcriptional regulator